MKGQLPEAPRGSFFGFSAAVSISGWPVVRRICPCCSNTAAGWITSSCAASCCQSRSVAAVTRAGRADQRRPVPRSCLRPGGRLWLRPTCSRSWSWSSSSSRSSSSPTGSRS